MERIPPYNMLLDHETGHLQGPVPGKGWYVGNINQPWELLGELTELWAWKRWCYFAVGASVGAGAAFLVCGTL